NSPKKKPAIPAMTGCPLARMLALSAESYEHGSPGEDQQQSCADEAHDGDNAQRAAEPGAFHLHENRAGAGDGTVLAVLARELELHALQHARDVVFLGAGVGVLDTRPVPAVDGDVTERQSQFDLAGDVAPRSGLAGR